MRKPVLPRLAGLLVLYTAVFILLTALQFSRQRNFTHRIDRLTVSGRLGEAGIQDGGGYFLGGSAGVFFEGMEFRMSGGDEGVILADSGGFRRNVTPEYLKVEDKRAVFHFSGGGTLSFSVFNTQAGPELWISGEFGEEVSSVEIPYRPMRNARSQDAGDGRPLLLLDGIFYSFGNSPLDAGRRLLFLEDPAFTAAYGAVPDKQSFDPGAYILPEAQSDAQYREILSQWRKDAYSRWSVSGPGSWRNSLDEELINAYIAEAIIQGAYRSAVTGVSAQFQQTYRSSVYLGSLNAAAESLFAFEQERAGYLAQLSGSGTPLGLLQEHRFIEFCAIRGYNSVIDAGAALIRGIDTGDVSFEYLPGILEGCVDWQLYRSPADNPFEGMIEPALALIAKEIRRENGGKVFAAPDGAIDLETVFRLGLALDGYGARTERLEWAALGRSLVLSALAQEGPSGDFPKTLRITTDGGLEEEEGARISAARIYRFIAAPVYPHAAVINTGTDGVWAWTAAGSIQTTVEQNVLDIEVSFPVGEEHYMLIQGLRPFARIQLYGMDFRTDPQFERYDSSGWVYNAARQTLLLKMRHQTPVEHVKIFWR
jgi:hypothetical protein